MKRMISLLVLLGSVGFLGVGCDWTSGGGVDSWNERWNWVNFSGVYRKAQKGYLVSDYSSVATVTETVGNTSGGAGGGEPETSASKRETFSHDPNMPSATVDLRHTPIIPGSVSVSTSGDISFSDDGEGVLVGTPRGSGGVTYDSGRLWLNFAGPGITSFSVSYIQQAPTPAPGVPGFASSGRLSRTPVVPGSVTMSVGATFALRDNGRGGLSGSGLTGTIDYNTGAWTIDYGTATVPPNTPIVATYRIQGGEGRGTTGKSVHTFSVEQEGERLRIVDNNGAVFEGRMGSVRGAGGYDGRGTPPEGETIIAQFSVSGASASGYSVEIVGTFQAVVASADAGQFSLGSRTITGTWVEADGRVGDVDGQAGPIRVTPPQPDPDPDPEPDAGTEE